MSSPEAELPFAHELNDIVKEILDDDEDIATRTDATKSLVSSVADYGITHPRSSPREIVEYIVHMDEFPVTIIAAALTQEKLGARAIPTPHHMKR